ncbi:hypothetical protein Rhopal_006939-T1 [Rhodotorula paludigena]|uniref:LSM domain-containing protein n=1 Tax=Rhodotorula paludigena TaxID=86838 RepID=A0AAV5GVC3_9BASI|nr:hypothetical protein Rhopal_006939-T1 [Rhodotorula paludigena]
MSADMRGRGRGRGGGGAGRGGAPGGGAGPRGATGGRSDDRPKREAILDLAKYVDQRVRVKFTGGREDPATSLPFVPEQRRSLGLAVLRGTSLVVISPADGSEEIANPFAAA